MKLIFKPRDDNIEWMRIKKGKVTRWYLYQSCGVHALTVGEVIIYMLVEKDYPTLNYHPEIIHQMLKPFWYTEVVKTLHC